jgi:hypothetical protein
MLLVVQPMPDRSKGRNQTKYSLWSSSLGVVRWVDDPTLGKIYCYETIEEAKAHTGL